jgi:hypothetical protein
MTRAEAIDLAVRGVRRLWFLTMPFVGQHGWSISGTSEAATEAAMRRDICTEFHRITADADRSANGVELCR